MPLSESGCILFLSCVGVDATNSLPSAHVHSIHITSVVPEVTVCHANSKYNFVGKILFGPVY